MRKSALLSVCVVALAITTFVTPTLGGVTVFLSGVTTIGGGAALGNPTIDANVGETFLLGVWVSSPLNTKIEGIVLDLKETHNLLTVVSVVYPDTGYTMEDRRWEIESNTALPNYGEVIGTADGNFAAGPNELWMDGGAVGVRSSGLGGTVLSRLVDGNYDDAVDGNGGAFLYAILEITAGLTEGDTDLFLYIGENKVAYVPSNDTNISFGTGDAAIDRTVEYTKSEVADATIRVPEPATMGVLAVGALGLIARRRRRR